MLAQPFAATQAPARVTQTTATLTGMATPNGSPTWAWFEWGTNTSHGLTTPPTDLGEGWGVTPLLAPVADLLPGATYHCRLVVSNEHGVAFGADRPFATGLKVAAWGNSAEKRTAIPNSASNIVDIAAGGRHSLALRTDGVVVAWGNNDFRQTNVPTGLNNVIAIAASGGHNLALRADGRVVAWGLNDRGQTNVPSGLTNVIAIAAGGDQSLALHGDGTVAYWGSEGVGNFAVSNTVGIGNWGYSLLLRADGTVKGYGDAARSWQRPWIPAGLTDVVAVAAGDYLSLALKADRTVAAWLPYDLDTGIETVSLTNVPTALDDVLAIAAGASHGLALRADGRVMAWGHNPYGVTNVPSGLGNAVAVAAGYDHSLALAPNVPPSLTPKAWSGGMNQDYIVRLPAVDPNNDPLTYRVASLPAAGGLYQYTASGQGEAIPTTNVVISDTLGRVVFAPAPNESGTPYAAFSIVANDGEDDSAPEMATINVLLPPTIEAASYGPNAQGMAFELGFPGFSNMTYNVWASTDLTNWAWLGPAVQATPGQFHFTDVRLVPDGSGGWWTNWPGAPMRFYQVRFYQVGL